MAFRAGEIDSIPGIRHGRCLAHQVPGLALQINNGRGEDQFLTVRGLNPDYNSIEIDGLQLPSTEETRRQVSLDIIPAVLVKPRSASARAGAWTRCPTPSAVSPSCTPAAPSRSSRREFFDSSSGLFALLDQLEAQVSGYQPSGQGDFTYSRYLRRRQPVRLSGAGQPHMRRSSSSLNSYTLGYSYYPLCGQRHRQHALAAPDQHHRSQRHPAAVRQYQRPDPRARPASLVFL